VTAETERDDPHSDIRHDVYFNRGVIGSQAYAREFGNREPEAENPRSKEMRWLSRGLFEALLHFIGLARDGMGLRAAFYEFHYQPVANALAKAIEDGVDVKIVYDAESNYKTDNEATIRTARLDQSDAVIPRTVSEGIRHNKFIVLLKGNKPIAVWTGSTNISAGGIFGHSNVGHIVWDEDVAQKHRLLAPAGGELDRPSRGPRTNRRLQRLLADHPRTRSRRCSQHATPKTATTHSNGSRIDWPTPRRSLA
jgi:phosphatidylserine/phosphatidylglycerophosphate/cardiolipin synthase-like enzyme